MPCKEQVILQVNLQICKFNPRYLLSGTDTLVVIKIYGFTDGSQSHSKSGDGKILTASVCK